MHRLTVFVLLAALVPGCKQEQKPAGPKAPAPAPAPAEKPAEPAPAEKPVEKPTEEPAEKPAEPSATEKARETLEGAAPADSQAALTSLREYIDDNPTAPDVAEASKLLAETAVVRAAAAAKDGDLELAATLARTILEDGKLAPKVSAGLVMGRASIEQVAVFLSTGDLDELPEVVELATGEGDVAQAAGQAVQARLAPILEAFRTEGTPEQRREALAKVAPEGEQALCPAARGEGKGSPQEVCTPEYYGLATKAELAAVPDAALPLMRLKAVAQLAGEEAPTGVLELPLPETERPSLDRRSAEAATFVPVEAVLITDQGVHLVTRPVARLGEPGLVSGEAWPGEPVMTAEALEAVEKPEDLQPLVEALAELREQAAAAEKTIYGEEAEAINAAREKGQWTALVAPAKETPAKRLMPVLRALEQAGYTDLRYLAEGDTTLAVPATREQIPEARRGGEERPVLVYVTADAVQVFPARGEGGAEKEEAEVALPAQAKRWYRGVQVYRVDVAGEDVAPVVQTVRRLRQQDAAGPTVLVAAAPEVPVERVTEVAAAIADAEGPKAQGQLSEVFPGLKCKDEDEALEGDACRTLFPVLPPAADVPSSRGLTEEPVRPERPVVKKPEPKPEPKPAPKAGFCKKSDIAKVFAGRRGSFKFCYERRLQLNQDLKGRVVVRLTIGPSGSVLSATSSGSMPDEKVHQCVLKAAKKLNFKPPEGGGNCVVNYPFVFQP